MRIAKAHISSNNTAEWVRRTNEEYRAHRRKINTQVGLAFVGGLVGCLAAGALLARILGGYLFGV